MRESNVGEAGKPQTEPSGLNKRLHGMYRTVPTDCSPHSDISVRLRRTICRDCSLQSTQHCLLMTERPSLRLPGCQGLCLSVQFLAIGIEKIDKE